MSSTITYAGGTPEGMFAVANMKVVTTTSEDVEIPCGFFPSRVEVVADQTTDGVYIWTVDMAETSFMEVRAAAGIQAGILVSAATTAGVNGFTLNLSETGAAGTFYVTLWR